MANIFKTYRELGHKEFMEKWKEGIERITPQQICKIKMNGTIGSILGTLLAAILFLTIYENLWAISIVMFFNIIIQIGSLIPLVQENIGYKRFEDMQSLDDVIKEMEVKDGEEN